MLRPAISALINVERGDFDVDPGPVDLAGELHQLVLHIDDLVEPGPKQIVFPRRLELLRPHRVLRCGIESRFVTQGNRQNELARFQGRAPPNLKVAKPAAAPKIDSASTA